jgi:HEAT repeat protein
MHSDSRVRANAAEALALTEPDPRVLEKNLLPLLNDPSNRVKANVLLALKNSSHPVLKDSLIKLAQGDEDHKLSAIYVISESDNPDNLDLLVQLKKSENQKISSRAGQALILIYCSFFSNKNELDYEKEKKYRQALLKAQINPDDLFDSVNKCGKKEIINKITLDRALFDLSSNNPGKRVSAIRILQFLNARAWVEKIKNFIDDPEQAVRYYARKALNSMGFFKDSAAQRSHYESIVSEPFELFKQKIVSPDPAVRLHTLDKAFTAAKTYGIEPVAAFLLENLKNEKSTFVLPSYIRQLGILAGKKALPEILPFLSNKDSRVRAFSVEAVQACRDEKALLLLMPLLDDEDNRVRANAVMALYHLEPAKALDTLDKMIYSHQPWMKESAVFVARKLGGPKIISALFEAFKYSKSYDLQIKLVRALADLQDISIIRDALEFQQVCKDKRSLLILEFLINSLSGKKEELNLKKIFHAHALGNGIDNSLIPESLIMNQPPDLRSLLESLNTFDEDIKINALKELAAKNNPALEQVFQSVYLKEKNFFLKSLSLHLMHTLFSQS